MGKSHQRRDEKTNHDFDFYILSFDFVPYAHSKTRRKTLLFMCESNKRHVDSRSTSRTVRVSSLGKNLSSTENGTVCETPTNDRAKN